ncbi:hypothetical protein [Microcoleus sp. B4-C1]|uniref:hypothetical protein n=1 Tax=Microcoleus sp. B4-C1 TaxID=2818660 RepID=UPI002FD3FCD7
MSKKLKSSQFFKGAKPAQNSENTAQEKVPNTATNSNPVINQNLVIANPQSSQKSSAVVQPEQMSLTAHQHIQEYLKAANKAHIEKEDLNAVLRLSQHLRVFGLLSAVGYLNQSNAQENNETRKRTVPVWGLLLGQMLGKKNASNALERLELMETVVEMARQNPGEYMAAWRKSLILAEQWNFWARAYTKGE